MSAPSSAPLTPGLLALRAIADKRKESDAASAPFWSLLASILKCYSLPPHELADRDRMVFLTRASAPDIFRDLAMLAIDVDTVAQAINFAAWVEVDHGTPHPAALRRALCRIKHEYRTELFEAVEERIVGLRWEDAFCRRTLRDFRQLITAYGAHNPHNWGAPAAEFGEGLWARRDLIFQARAIASTARGGTDLATYVDYRHDSSIEGAVGRWAAEPWTGDDDIRLCEAGYAEAGHAVEARISASTHA